MRGFRYIFCMILVVNVVSLAGQPKSDLRELFSSAEGDLLFEDYAEALPKYLSLLQIYPDNYNLFFRIGQCYLNTPGEKDKAIAWLETAAGHINPEYRGGRLRESGAPYDVLYFLANAYRIASSFERALETYELFLKDVDTQKYDTTLVRFQMQTCYNARLLMRKPVFIADTSLGASVNDRFSEFNPVSSADEKTLLFTRELQFYDAIFWSGKIDGKWSEPVNLTPQLGVDQDYYTSSLSPDGQTLLMYRPDTYDGNIYMSRLKGDTWSKVEKLNGNINTRFWESHATMSSDGEKIYFTSNRKESIGGLDIFVSARDSSGNWGPAVNLGPEINTVYNEETPFLANNDRTLFFSSRGHFNIGGYDIFRSDLDENGNWSAPVNIGYPLNTPDDDLFFTPVGIGDRGYHAKFADDGYGKMDLYVCNIYTQEPPPLTPEQEMEPEAYTDTASTGAVLQEPADISVSPGIPADTMVAVASPGVVNSEIITGKNLLPDNVIISPDSLVRNEQHPAGTVSRAGEMTEEKTGKRAVAPVTDTTVIVPSVTATTVAVASVTATNDTVPPSVTAATDQAETATSLAGSAEDDLMKPGIHGEGKDFSFWWLLLLAALLLLFLLWIRGKKKNNDKQ